ncbi:MAG: hypothetical protein AABX28_00430 [Nanoarchaeota archaeon]
MKDYEFVARVKREGISYLLYEKGKEEPSTNQDLFLTMVRKYEAQIRNMIKENDSLKSVRLEVKV